MTQDTVVTLPPKPGPAETGAPFTELRSGDLGVRLANGAAEIDAMQALRYQVFYQEMGARPDAATAAAQRDRDIYDTVADHLLVVDHSLGEGPESVVGTYRLIQREAAQILGHFYSADEYDITPIEANRGGILERRDFGGGRARYEPSEDGPHYHLIDVETGKVVEFQDPEHERLMHVIAERLGFDMVSLRLELFGRRRGAVESARGVPGNETNLHETDTQSHAAPASRETIRGTSR